MKKFLKVERGNVKCVSSNGTTQRTYYSKGNAVRADWYDEEKESVEVQTTSKIYLISCSGTVIRTL